MTAPIPDDVIERAARAMFEREHSFMSTLAGATRWTYDDASMEIKIYWQKHARAALEASGLVAEVERLTREREAMRESRMLECEGLRTRIAELEAQASGLAEAGRLAELRHLKGIADRQGTRAISREFIDARIAELSGAGKP